MFAPGVRTTAVQHARPRGQPTGLPRSERRTRWPFISEPYTQARKEPGHEVNRKRSAAGRNTRVCITSYKFGRAARSDFLFALVAGVRLNFQTIAQRPRRVVIGMMDLPVVRSATLAQSSMKLFPAEFEFPVQEVPSKDSRNHCLTAPAAFLGQCHTQVQGRVRICTSQRCRPHGW